MGQEVGQRVASDAVARAKPPYEITIDISLPQFQFYDIQNEPQTEVVFTSIGIRSEWGSEIGSGEFFTPNGRNPLKSLDSKK
jgi:hypothetical protein